MLVFLVLFELAEPVISGIVTLQTESRQPLVKTIFLAAVFLIPPAFAAPHPAADNIITNGDFEAEPCEDEGYPFYQTPGWYNRADKGQRQDIIARTRKENSAESLYTASINNTNPSNSIFLQRTNHQIKAGEIYNLSLDFRPSFNWRNWDLLRVTVFATTDDTLGGAVVWEDSVDLENPAGQSWSNVTHVFQPAPSDAEGRRIYFAFQGVGDEKTEPQRETGYARVDNIKLTLAP